MSFHFFVPVNSIKKMGRSLFQRQLHGLARGADTPAHVRREERVRIRQGQVVHEHVWLDGWGNELDKVGEDPLTFRVRPSHAAERQKGPVIHGYPDPPADHHTVELKFIQKKTTGVAPRAGGAGGTTEARPPEEVWLSMCLLSSAVLMCALWFLLGYWMGRRRGFPPVPTTAPLLRPISQRTPSAVAAAAEEETDHRLPASPTCHTRQAEATRTVSTAAVHVPVHVVVPPT